MNKTNNLVFWISTGLVSALMLMSAGMYLFNYQMVAETFTKLGYPTYLIYPLAFAKILGIIAIISNKSRTLKEWAYAGFFFDFILAAAAHIQVGDGEFLPAGVALILLLISYFFDKKLGRDSQI